MKGNNGICMCTLEDLGNLHDSISRESCLCKFFHESFFAVRAEHDHGATSGDMFMLSLAK